MLRSRSLAAAVLGSLLTLVGCKQNIGERCEKSSDCSSGFCGNDNSDQGSPGVSKTCTAGRETVIPEAGAPMSDAASDRSDASATESGDASDAPASDVALESHAESGGDTAASEGGTDVAPEAGGDTSVAEAGPDLGGDALTGDAAGN
jgi:hypothetical protein